MDSPIAEILMSRAPKFFGPRSDGRVTSFGSYGFQCHPGWAPLLYDLLGELERLIVERPELADMRVLQIKEKFGVLKIYVSDHASSDDVWNLLERYQQASSEVCERCGEPGELIHTDFWARTACKNPMHQDPRKFSIEEQDTELARCTEVVLARLREMEGSK
jgi:hypothetical protein